MINFAKIVLTKCICSGNINLQTKQQTTYKNLINDEKVDREENVRGSLNRRIGGTSQWDQSTI